MLTVGESDLQRNPERPAGRCLDTTAGHREHQTGTDGSLSGEAVSSILGNISGLSGVPGYDVLFYLLRR